MKAKRLWLSVLTGCAMLIGARADSATNRPTTAAVQAVPEIVVTAVKTPLVRTNATQTITVLDEKDIANTFEGKGNLAELLTFQPGAAVTVLSRNDANWGSYGGLGPKYSTYMLDGLPMDAFVDTQALDPWAIKRVEVQRGPAAVLYPNYLSQDFAGNQSPLAGTVNVLTHDDVVEPLTRLDGAYGSYNTYRLRGYHEDLVGPLSYFGGVSYEKSDYTDYGSKDSWLHMLDNPEYTKLKIYGGGTLKLSDDGNHRLSIFGNWTEHDGDAGRPNRKFDHKYTLIQGGYTAPLGADNSLNAKLGYRRYDRTWEEDNFSNGGDLSLASHNGAVQNIIPADVSLCLAHGTWGKLTLGSDFQRADYQTYTDSGHRVIGNDGVSDQYGLYAQEQLTLDQWVLRGGGRVNRITQDIDLLSGVEPGDNHAAWNKFLWSAGTRYNGWAPVAPFANVGTSFMAPSLKSVGGTLQASDRGVAGRNGQLPNPDLQPEKGVGGDFGLDIQLATHSLLTLRTFANVIDDAIVENVVSKTPSQSQSVNAGKTTALGFEAALKCRLTDWVDGFANYTYTHSRISNSIDRDQDGATVPFVPENMGDVGITLLLPGNLTISPSLHWSGSIYDSSSISSRQKFDSYELVNVMVRKGLIRDGKRSVDLYLELYNITNNHYEMPWQFQDPGFSAMAGIQATF